MSTIGPEYHEQLEIPSRCQSCPMLTQLEKSYIALTEETDAFIESMFAGELEDNLKEVCIQEGMTEAEADEALELNREMIQKESASLIEDCDENRRAQVTLGQKVIDACQGGALTMRGQRDDMQVTVTVCMSDVMSISQYIEGSEPTTIRRKMIDEF